MRPTILNSTMPLYDPIGKASFILDLLDNPFPKTIAVNEIVCKIYLLVHYFYGLLKAMILYIGEDKE